MTFVGWIQVLVFFGLILAVTKPIGAYMFRVFEGGDAPLGRGLGRIENAFYRLFGVDPRQEQDWKAYTFALLAFSTFGVLVTYAIQRLQGHLPLNPQHFAAWAHEPRFQHRRQLHHQHQLAGLRRRVDDEPPDPDGGSGLAQLHLGRGRHCVALAVARGFTRRGGPGGGKQLGNFWVDLNRGILYVLLPLSFIFALVLVSQGVIQNLKPYLDVTTLEGGKQTLALGPVASQEAIKQLGTNGGGFFNANSAHPFENPTPFTNLDFAVPHLHDPCGADLHLRPDGQGFQARLGAAGRDERAVLRRRRRLLSRRNRG